MGRSLECTECGGLPCEHFGDPMEHIALLRAEVAALREEFSSYVTRSSEDWMKLERKLAEARAEVRDLAILIDRMERLGWSSEVRTEAANEARAILRCDEAPACFTCGSREPMEKHVCKPRDEARLGETRWNVGAQTFITRDEARQCTCGDYALSGMHWSNCPARDEVPTQSSSTGESKPPRR